ncbi:MAG: HNH endonuclease [Endomicrobium sp.]|nr:HNH endonuclease [Endomicrobium sp.]
MGKNFIEIHHKKPVYQYENDDTEQTIKKALSNLAHVCSNCHRMIHRNRNPLDIAALKQIIIARHA